MKMQITQLLQQRGKHIQRLFKKEQNHCCNTDDNVDDYNNVDNDQT